MTRLVIILMLVCATPFSLAKEVGQSIFARGAVTAESLQGKVRVIGKKSPIHEGDVISTGKKSFAVLKLKDGTRMTLRPNTIFKVEQFEHEKEAEESAVLRLFKGGLRAITGFISKKNPNAYRLKTSVATIGIRGTEFDARLCDEDCQKEARTSKTESRAKAALPVARIAFLRGELSGQGAEGPIRKMAVGAPVYEGDLLTTANKSFAVLAFRDKSRITLKSSTSFKVEQMKYNKEKPEEGSAVFRLFKGGLRALSGLIGRNNPRAVKFSTPVATIGIRGTGFDLHCQGSCVEAPLADNAESKQPAAALQRILAAFIPEATAQAAIPQGNGLFANVWSGAIVFQLDGGDLLINEGKTFFLPNSDSPPIPLAEIPVFMQQDPAPRPDKVDIDHGNLFDASQQTQVEPGLYLSLYEGHLSVDDGNETKDIGAGEAMYVDGNSDLLLRMEIIPPFQSNDPYLKMINQEFENVFDLLGGQSDGEFECVIQ